MITQQSSAFHNIRKSRNCALHHFPWPDLELTMQHIDSWASQPGTRLGFDKLWRLDSVGTWAELFLVDLTLETARPEDGSATLRGGVRKQDLL